MNTSSSAPASHAPHLRNLGTSTSTAVTVSAMPSSRAAARLRFSGTLACARRTAAAMGSVIFHSPATMNNSDVRIAAIQLRAVFQAGSSSVGTACCCCAILWVILYILALFTVAAFDGSQGSPAPGKSAVNACSYSGNMNAPALLLLFAAGVQPLADEIFQVPAGEWRYVSLALKQVPVTVECDARVISGGSAVRVALLNQQGLDDLKQGDRSPLASGAIL